MKNLHSNIKELIEITEAFEGVKNYLTKSPYRTAAMATSLAMTAGMMKSGIYNRTTLAAAGDNLSAAGQLAKLRDTTSIPGSEVITNNISKGIQHTINAGKEVSNSMFGTDFGTKDVIANTMGISWLPIAAGLTAYGISRLVRHFKSIKYREAKIKKLQQILPKIKNPAKIQAIRKHIQNLQIEVNAQKSVMNQQKQESMKQMNFASQNQDLKKNPEKLKELNKSKQILGKIH